VSSTCVEDYTCGPNQIQCVEPLVALYFIFA